MSSQEPNWKQELSLLKSYQDHYLTAEACTKAIAALDDRRAAVRAEVEAAQTALGEKQEEKQAAESKRKSEELEIEAAKVHIQESEAKLFSIKTNKEYQAALKEVADGKQAVKMREEGVLALMEATEAAEQEITQLSQAVTDKKSACADELAAVEAEAGTLAEQQSAALVARGEVEQQLHKKTLRAYQQVQRRYPDGLAVAQENGGCSGCNMNVLPQQLVELRKSKKLVTCTTCYRILVWHEDVVGEGNDDEQHEERNTA